MYNTKYRFGFNGKEMDNDFNRSAATFYDYGFRIHNAQIANFLSVDSLTDKYPELTPYQFAADRPIDCIDIDGLENAQVHHFANATVEKNDLTPQQARAIADKFKINELRPGTHHIYYDKDNKVIKERVDWNEHSWITLQYDWPLFVSSAKFIESSHYFDGERGFGERGGGKLLLNTALTVATLGYGYSIFANTGSIKSFFINTKLWGARFSGDAILQLSIGGVKNYDLYDGLTTGFGCPVFNWISQSYIDYKPFNFMDKNSIYGFQIFPFNKPAESFATDLTCKYIFGGFGLKGKISKFIDSKNIIALPGEKETVKWFLNFPIDATGKSTGKLIKTKINGKK